MRCKVYPLRKGAVDVVVKLRVASTLRPRVTCLSAGAFVLFAFACGLRPDIAVGLIVLGAVYSILERIRPVHDQAPAIRRTGWRTDMVHFVVDEVLSAGGFAAGLLLLLPLLRGVIPHQMPVAIRSQQAWVVWVQALMLAEVLGYWGHRLTHQIPFLWRFHRVHHSSRQLDWLAPNRRHPLDMLFARLSVALPMLAFGFAVPMVVTHFVIKRFQGLLVHANVDVRLGALEWVVSTPHFHHWHHADQPEAHNKNFAGQAPLVDWLFGTLYRPDDWPERYGCDGYVPDVGYFAQLAAPWRRGHESQREKSTTKPPASEACLSDLAGGRPR